MDVHSLLLLFVLLSAPLSRRWDPGQGHCSIHPLPLNQCSAHRRSSVNMTGWLDDWSIQNPFSSGSHAPAQPDQSLTRCRSSLLFSIHWQLWSCYYTHGSQRIRAEDQIHHLEKIRTHTAFLLGIITNICTPLFLSGKFHGFVLILLKESIISKRRAHAYFIYCCVPNAWNNTGHRIGIPYMLPGWIKDWIVKKHFEEKCLYSFFILYVLKSPIFKTILSVFHFKNSITFDFLI